MPCDCPSSGAPRVREDARPGELCPWTRLQGSTGTTVVTQPSAEWVDAKDFIGALVGIDVRDYSSDVRIYVQTSNTLDDASFVDLINHRPTVAGRKYFKLLPTDTTPILRYVRWKTGNATAAWRAQFRIVANFKRRDGR